MQPQDKNANENTEQKAKYTERPTGQQKEELLKVAKSVLLEAKDLPQTEHESLLRKFSALVNLELKISINGKSKLTRVCKG
ncbi:MAG: hypothetical protein HC878_00020 [Leptolyngbyaceae cyanobacterium SL_5_14]|nr:hypothetical protein [Leptolyngbyaceae cyanobacterium SL_5_14]